MSGLSAFGVRAAAGTLADRAGEQALVLPHVWTPTGVRVTPVGNGAQLLHLSVAVCVLNDTYREAEQLGVPVSGVAVVADGGFDDDWASTGIGYVVEVDGPATGADRSRLLAAVDEKAEIPRALRAGAEVSRRHR
ncbi:OsmC family peroxiredoxin [Nocardioides sp. zg-536]|uniref:OsmC family peroxiredoxin n=1 Tax=Nocardioides faecalis TaxID=2803858 RepID=A0A939BXQ8_9ACTN|nr:OsmC family peroxiredoxin [Nocardioides faecalis]MBM9459553.1 OsmC family peroxiredoxin [Nocardioides faecalis]QVI58085.1 OsmC family peroxiredoxin [Nocardioides faecalis]